MNFSEDKSTSFSQHLILKCGDRIIDLTTPAVMGILNLTPDSFFDGGKLKSDLEILQKVEKMINAGADIIDMGAVSTRPGATTVSEIEELKRLLPAFKKVSGKFPESIISIDTYRSRVAAELIQSGAHIINDISGGTFDPMMFNLIAETKVPYILMHIKGTPENMQNNPVYLDVTIEVKNFFKAQLYKLKALGIHGNIVLDPGFGFGKNLEHNYQLLKELEQIKKLGFPILAGMSRKSMVNKVLNTIPESALNGTTVLNTIALLNGANILRVHDVKEAKEAISLVEQMRSC
jgi:dihydropteroate synthase